MAEDETKRRDGALLVRDESRETTVDVDVTLIDEMLRLTPKQRLEQNDRMATLAVRLRAAFEAGRGKPGWTSRLVLGLETLVELKRQSIEAKDRLMLPVLEETLRRLRR